MKGLLTPGELVCHKIHDTWNVSYCKNNLVLATEGKQVPSQGKHVPGASAPSLFM